MHQIAWIYFHLIKFHSSESVTLKKLKTVDMELYATIAHTSMREEKSFDVELAKSISKKSKDVTSGLYGTNVAPNDASDVDSDVPQESATFVANSSSVAVFHSRAKVAEKQGRAEAQRIKAAFDQFEAMNLEQNHHATKIKMMILKFRLVWTGAILSIIWIAWLFFLYFLHFNKFGKVGTKLFIGSMCCIHLCVEFYVWRLLYTIYRGQSKKLMKYSHCLTILKAFKENVQSLDENNGKREENETNKNLKIDSNEIVSQVTLEQQKSNTETLNELIEEMNLELDQINEESRNLQRYKSRVGGRHEVFVNETFL